MGFGVWGLGFGVWGLGFMDTALLTAGWGLSYLVKHRIQEYAEEILARWHILASLPLGDYWLRAGNYCINAYHHNLSPAACLIGFLKEGSSWGGRYLGSLGEA